MRQDIVSSIHVVIACYIRNVLCNLSIMSKIENTHSYANDRYIGENFIVFSSAILPQKYIGEAKHKQLYALLFKYSVFSG